MEEVKLTRDKLGRGDLLIEVDGTTAVLHEAGARKLKLCKCTRFKWNCEPGPNGDTYCYQVCEAWTCKEVPANLQIKG